MHDLVQLRRQLGIEGGDRAIDGARQVPVKGNRPCQRLLDERLDEFLGAIRFGLLGGRNHLIKQRRSFGRSSCCCGGFGSNLGVRNGLALLLADPELARQGFELVLVL